MFIRRSMHDKIVKAKEDEITELRIKTKDLEEKIATKNEEIDWLRSTTKNYIKVLIENSEQKNTIKDLKYENAKLREIKTKVIEIITHKGTVVDKYDKIKELVDKLETSN